MQVEAAHPSNVQSLSEKLTSLGLSAAVGGYQSDSSDEGRMSLKCTACIMFIISGRDGLEEQDDEKVSSPVVSPLHEASILPQECEEDETPAKINVGSIITVLLDTH